MRRLLLIASITLLLAGCATIGTINWTDEGSYCLATAEQFWSFDRSLEAFDLIGIKEVIDDPTTVLLPQGTRVKVLVNGTNSVSSAKVEVLDGDFKGTICWTYQGAVEE